MLPEVAAGPAGIDDAARIAMDEINRNETRKFALVHGSAVDRVFGWVFDYNSKEFVDTGNPGKMVPGCGGVVVMRDGTAKQLGTHGPPDRRIGELESLWLENLGANK